MTTQSNLNLGNLNLTVLPKADRRELDKCFLISSSLVGFGRPFRVHDFHARPLGNADVGGNGRHRVLQPSPSCSVARYAGLPECDEWYGGTDWTGPLRTCLARLLPRISGTCSLRRTPAKKCAQALSTSIAQLREVTGLLNLDCVLGNVMNSLQTNIIRFTCALHH